MGIAWCWVEMYAKNTHYEYCCCRDCREKKSAYLGLRTVLSERAQIEAIHRRHL